VSTPSIDRLLVVMAKAPRPGHAKTRLAAAGLDAGQVLALYRCLMEDTLDLASSLAQVRIALMCPAGDSAAVAAWLGPDRDIVEQPGAGLADALDATFTLFRSRRVSRIIALNGDSPHLPARVLANAFEALAGHDLVVGPTDDGGYYLVGARQPYRGLFERSALGTGRALDDLLARARERGLRVATTDPWFDVDVGQDVDRLEAALVHGSVNAPRTHALLTAWRGR
jgi:rSAM/selenodomain-associated transferase 1